MSSSKESSPVRIAVAGLGRSGWNIHVSALERASDQYQIVAVADAQEDRRAEAVTKFGCKAYETFEELIQDESAEAVVIATPNHLHADHAVAALGKGKHVVVEKPMATSAELADDMIAAARKADRQLAVFLNRRYDPHFLEVQRVIESGALGRIVQVRMAVHGFSRRWDWQTLQKFGGGTLNNAGPHFLDQALQIFGDTDPEVSCHLDTALTLGDADDHAVVTLRDPRGAKGSAPLVQLEMTSACAFPQDLWLVMGTGGTLRGTVKELHWKMADFSKLPERTADADPTPGRKYNSEEITWTTDSWQVPQEQSAIQWTHDCFYRDLFETLRHGAPLKITPESVRRQIAVMDQCRKVGGYSDLQAGPRQASQPAAMAGSGA